MMDNNEFEKIFKQHLAADQSRLDRIENKIDKLADTVIALARAEEKLINLERSRRTILDTLDNHEERLDSHEKRLQDGDVTLNSITKVFWTTLTAAIGSLVVYFTGS
jgi:ABC-type Fe3+-citrate transport system substrate-binding protein